MRKLLYLFILFFCGPLVKAQQNEFVYLQFNRCGEDICIIPKSEEGRYHGKIEIKKYEKIKQVNGDIEFYICGESVTEQVKDRDLFSN